MDWKYQYLIFLIAKFSEIWNKRLNNGCYCIVCRDNRQDRNKTVIFFNNVQKSCLKLTTSFRQLNSYQSILFSPEHHLFGRLAAANTGVCDLFLMEWNTARFYAGILFDLLLTSNIAAPHCFDEAVFLVGNLQELVLVGSGIGTVFPVFQRTLI